MNIKHNKIKEIVSEELSCSAHSYDHVIRVHNLCLLLAETEKNVNMDVLVPAVLLHDIARVREDADDSGLVDHAVLGTEMAERILQDLDYDEVNIERIKHCILSHRYRSGYQPQTIEAKILFDADKLDAIGAVGLARTFMFAGKSGARLYVDLPLDKYIEDNITANGRIKRLSKHSPYFEYEMKLKKIIYRLYTSKAKEIAENRITVMEQFFEGLKNEIEGRQ